jgi:hypothetical protein
MDAEDSLPHKDTHDLVHSIKSMYRVLDLISEQGSGGLGDFIFLSEPPFESLIFLSGQNYHCAGFTPDIHQCHMSRCICVSDKCRL